MPKRDKNTLVDFEKFAHAVIHSIPMISFTDVKDLPEWIASAPYTGARKDYFMRLMESTSVENTKRDPGVEMFLKDEDYPSVKIARSINSPSDVSKLILAPIVQAVEKKTYAHFKRYFVKGTQPADWPKKLSELFGTDDVRGTDFTSMEAHHTKEFNDVIRYWIMHVIRNIGGPSTFRRLIAKLIGGTNKCHSSAVDVTVDERLMSGAMWTSSANGMLNFLLMSYMTLRTRHPTASPDELASLLDTFKGVFEGDDGLCVTECDDDIITKLGLRLKIEPPCQWHKAAFCQIICDIEDEEMAVMTNPLKVLRKLFVLPAHYAECRPGKRAGLLRAKALSYKYNFGNVPIVGVLFDKILELTRSVDHREHIAELCLWGTGTNREAAIKAFDQKIWRSKASVKDSARVLVQDVYGIPIDDQLLFESEIRGQTSPEIVLSILPYVSSWQLRYVYRHLGMLNNQPPQTAAPITGTASVKCRKADAQYGRSTNNLFLF